jgi:hypothetical protein
MANKKISELTPLTLAALGDLLETVDISDLTDSPQGTNKQITAQNLLGLISSVLIPGKGLSWTDLTLNAEVDTADLALFLTVVNLATDVTGLLKHENGGLEVDASAYAGLLAITGGATSEVNDKAGLEALLTDVADFAMADGDTYTGVHDFGGAASLEIPNGNPTLNAAGEIGVETTSKTLNYYSDAEYALNPIQSKSFFVESPTADDDLPIHRFDAAHTLVKTVYAIGGTTNWVGQLQEATDAQGTGATDTQASDSTVTTTTTVTSYSNATFDAGDYAFLKSASISGTPDWLHVTFYYKMTV